MFTERVKTRGVKTETVSHERPRELSHAEMVESAMTDIAAPLALWHITPTDIETFIDQKITGIRLNGVDVLSIDIDHKGLLDPITVAYLNASRTKVIMPEYFHPELVENGGIFSSMRESSTDPRLSFAQNISTILQQSGKDIAVADIANRPSYEITHLLSRYLPYLGVLGSAALATRTGTAGLLGDIGLAVNAPAAALMTGNSHQEMSKTGIFNPDRIPRLDRFIPDWEQARRLILAKGVEQVTTEYRPTGKQGEVTPQIILLYPQAHGIRMADILENPHPFMDKAQAAAYRLLGPTMDFSVRTYRWKNSLQKLSESGYRYGQPDIHPPTQVFPNTTDNLAGWMRVSNRKIKI